tara:strand:- start:105 stop:431 length:327 start_codon:yes stop_codon:yes gene_type:complete
MKIFLGLLVFVTGFLGLRVLQLELEVEQLQKNSAIAVLSAEAANKKIGAIAPFFSQDKEAFAKAWLDSVNLPPAVFPSDILMPLKRTLEEKRSDKASRTQMLNIFGLE